MYVHTAEQAKRLTSVTSPPWEPQISNNFNKVSEVYSLEYNEIKKVLFMA